MTTRIKHGTVCESTGNVFWSYDSGGRERWFTKERFDEMRKRARENQRKRYWANIDDSRSRLRELHHKNKDKKKINFSNWLAKNRHKVRGNRIQRTYGITSDEYFLMFEAQLGICLICGNPQQSTQKDGEVRFLCVDHCHKTGKVRGLLCTKCNTGIGQFMEDPEVLINAAGYLARFQTAPAEMGGVNTQSIQNQ